MPASLLWTDTSGDHKASTVANWHNQSGGADAVPGQADTAQFGFSGSGANTDCLVDANWHPQYITMDNTYTAKMTVDNGITLTVSNTFTQYGDLDVEGGATVDIGTLFDAYGDVSNSGAGTATITTTGDVQLRSGAELTATGGAGKLALDAGTVVAHGDVAVGSTTSSGELDVDASSYSSDGSTDVHSGSTLKFLSSAHPSITGTVSLDNATIVTGGEMEVGGTFDVTGNSTFEGDLGLVNGADLTVGSTSGAGAALDLTAGSLFVGCLTDSGATSTATVTLKSGGELEMPAATGRSDQFYVSSQGTVEMQGAVILMEPSRVSTLENHGTLDSAGSSSGSGDALYGNLDNDGTLEFTGSLHMLMVSANPSSNSGGTFTQGSTGKLEVRVDNSAASDRLLNAGHVILDGELDVSEVSALTTGQRWTIISSSNPISGDFATEHLPDDGNPNWDAVLPAGSTNYFIDN